MKRNLFSNFIRCGIFGWCLECLFTGLCSLRNKKDKRFLCTTSLWMFPIYGLAAFILPISKLLSKCNVWIRGGIYTIGIFSVEYVTGILLKEHKACPWDYSKAKFNIKGVIRLDYAPLWFIVGLLYEKLNSSK